MLNPGFDALERHKELIKNKSRNAYNSQSDLWRRQLMISNIFSGVCLVIATIAIALAYKTASSVVLQNTVRTTDRFGQTIGMSGSVTRVPTGFQTHAFINSFITDVFTIVDSPAAMQRNYAEAQSDIDAQSPVSGYLHDFWASSSPLSGTGAWDRSRSQEKIVELLSLLDRGKYSNGGGEEYEVEFSVKADLGSGHLGNPQVFRGDLVLVPGANPTDANPWGVLVSHFSWSQNK